MSDIGEVDLNEFQRSEAWFTRLKAFLLKDGSPLIKNTKKDLTQESEEEEKDSMELDFDLSESFASLLEEHKKKKNSIDSITMQENKENINVEALKSPYTPKFGKQKTYTTESDNVCNKTQISHLNFDESTFIGETSLWRQTTDESFEFLESAYNKTSSCDSDITLRSRDTNKSKFGSVKKSGNITKICLANQTQINDIEAPSALWDSSLIQSNDKSILAVEQLQAPTYQTSPVKMVGLLRPSTIFEESGVDISSAENSISSNSTSFKTVPGIKTSDEASISSDQFQSANESLKSESKWTRTNNNTEKTKSEDSLVNSSTDQNLKISLMSDKPSYVRRKFYDDDENFLPSYDTSSDTKSLDSLNSNRTDTIKTENSKSMLDDSLNTSQSSICEISNDSLITNKTNNESSNCAQKSFVVDKNLIDFNKSIKHEPMESKSYSFSSSIIELSDDESDMNPNGEDENLNQGFSVVGNEGSDIDENAHENESGSVENESGSVDENEPDSVDQDVSNSGDRSGLSDSTLNTSTPREFNDTIEEMDYIMKKAVKYLSETGTTPKLMKNNQAMLSPGGFSKNSKQRTPSPCNYPKSPVTPNTVVSKGAVKKFLTPTPIKSVSKESPSHFKMPSSRIPLPKSTTNSTSAKKQIGFQHVISPIGAYIRNTPTLPIVVSSKSRNNLLESKTVRNLELESRSVGTTTVKSPTKIINAGNAKVGCALPKKAYISSEYKHYFDDRTPIKIPGGDKIHKYLESAKLPTIIKHDGRVKLNELYSTADSDRSEDAIANRTVDSSIADLSVMSGEVSLLTIKDAQKFGRKH